VPELKTYRFAPQVVARRDGARVTRVTIEPDTDRVTMELLYVEGATHRGVATLSFTEAQLDAFINAAASFPGTGFVEKILNFFAASGVLPAGGTVETTTV
jgi:hypothetical protein